MEAARRRLRLRYGARIDPWLDDAPAVLASVGERWGLRFDGLVPSGSTSLVARCATTDGRAAILKLAPDAGRLRREAAALRTWATRHVPAVYEADVAVGALLIERIEPGDVLGDAASPPSMEAVGALVAGLHAVRPEGGAFPPLAALASRLFDSWERLRRAHPELVELVPDDLFDRSRGLAGRLARDAPSTVLLHGDLTPVNVLDGGPDRGLVAIDPSPCLGDPAYDSIDLLVWQAADLPEIEGRAATLATATGVDATRLLDWGAAFAGMFVLDLAGPGQRHADDWRDRVEPLLALASHVAA